MHKYAERMSAMMRYNMIAIKLGPNDYNGLLVDLDEVVEGRTIYELKRKGAKILAQEMREKKDLLPNFKFDINEIYRERTKTDISEFEMKNLEIVKILLELNDKSILFEGKFRV